MILYFVFVICAVIQQASSVNPPSDAMAKMTYEAQQKAAMAEALAMAAPYAAMGIPVTITPNTPPPPPEPESEGTEPEPPSDYDDLFTYSGYFDPYGDDVQAFMINGQRRKRHRKNCGKDRKGRHCDFRRSHHQHSFYNKDCIHYAGSLEIYGIWQCGSRKNLRDGAIIRMQVELHELLLKYKQDKNIYAMERFERILQYNRKIYARMKQIFIENANKNMVRVLQALADTNEQVFENFKQLFDMSQDLILQIIQDREYEIDELKDQLRELLEEYPPPISICQNMSGCGMCLERPGCVFCTEEQMCYEGDNSEGAFYYTCDVWVQNGECEEEDDEAEKKAQKVNNQEELYDFTQQKDLDLTQKLYMAQKQREMYQVKNQIQNRRQVLSQFIAMNAKIKQSNVQLIEEYIKNEKYDQHFLDQVDEGEADEGKDKFFEEIEELYEDENADKEAMQKRIANKKEKEKKQEEKEKKMYAERHKATTINKKEYKDKAQLDAVLKKEKKKDAEAEEEEE